MTSPFISEIRMFGGNFAPRGWALCNGQIMAIAQNQALFALIGTTYGGNGVQTFSLPDLQGRLPMGQGAGPGLTARVIGETAGTETVQITQSTMPAHNHPFSASTVNATTATIGSTTLPGVVAPPGHFYTINNGANPPPTVEQLAAGSVGQTGGSQPHSNLMPALCVSFIIAVAGIFPTRN